MATRERGVRWKAALAVFLFAWTLTTHGKYSASGDEPHYLMITQSIVADHDLDVENNYVNNDGRLFGHDHLEMGLHAVPARNGRIRPIHDIGLAVALVPIYFVAERLAQIPSETLLARVRMDRGLFAYSIVSLFLIVMTAAGLMLLAEGLSSLTSVTLATVLIIAAGVSPPIVSHSFLVFPEALALFVTCLVVWFAVKRPGGKDPAQLMAVVFTLGLLPWAHHKYLLYVPGLLFVIGWKRLQVIRGLSWARRLLALALFVLPQVALLVWTWTEWGTLGGALTTSGLPFSPEMLKSGLLGLWIDRQSGLLAYAPMYWIVPACCYLTRRTTWPFLVPAVLLYLPAASFAIGWWAGFSPAARYLVPLMPFCLVAIAEAMRYRAIRIAAIVLLIPQAILDAVVWQHPRTLWPSPEGNTALQALGWAGRAYERILPPEQSGGSLVAALQLGMVAVIASGALILASRRQGS
jgi:hypothetical protein